MDSHHYTHQTSFTPQSCGYMLDFRAGAPLWGFLAYLLFSFVFKTTATPSYTAEPPTQATRHRILRCYYTTPNTFWTVSPLLGIAASIPGLARSGAPTMSRPKTNKQEKGRWRGIFQFNHSSLHRQWKFPESTTLREDWSKSWSQWCRLDDQYLWQSADII